MKTFKYLMLAFAAIMTSVAFTSCEKNELPEPEPEPKPEPVEAVLGVETSEIGVSIVKIAVTSQNITDFAYQLSDEELTVQALYGTGTKVTIEEPTTESVTEVELTGLESGKSYKLWFAARTTDGKFYKDVVCVEFTTTFYTDTLTVVDTMYDGFKVYMKIPDDVKERGNGVRYTTADLAFYNYTLNYKKVPDPSMLLTNAQQCTTEDKLIIYDDYYSIERDENGDVIYDENGNLISASYAETKVPGEPGVFFAGEFEYYHLQDPVENPETGELEYDTGPYGWGEGYFIACYDWSRYDAEEGTDSFDQDKYWTGYHERIRVNCKDPQPFDGSVDIKVYDKTPINAMLRFTPTDDVQFYIINILEDSEYQANALPLLENNEDYMQWFITSVFGTYTYGAITANSMKDVYLTDWFADTKGMGGKTIHVFVTAMGDNKGRTQSFQKFTFELPVAQHPAPDIVITPIENEETEKDPYNAYFNIKNLSTERLVEAKYNVNYVREFNAILKSYSYTSLLSSMGYPFTADDLEKINSPEGLDVVFSSRENATTRIAVLAHSWEGRHNDPDEPESTSVAEYTTPHASYPERVESSLFDELVGEWTATAEMIDYDTDKEDWVEIEPYTSDVFISAGVTYPEELPDEVYQIYEEAGVSKAKTEELWEEFKSQADQYNRRTRGFNRLLCLGYDFTDPKLALSTIADPYLLFAHEDYGFQEVSHIFYDFGPKWNLEIDKDGSVWLPIDIEREFPLETFNFGMDYTLYMLAVSTKSYIGAPIRDAKGDVVFNPRFPVEVSADRNTITIKPITREEKNAEGETVTLTYYPCIAQLQYGMATPTTPRVGGEVVLTRKSSSATRASVNGNAVASGNEAPAVRSYGKTPTPLKPSRSMTPMHESMIKVYERIGLQEPIVRGEEAFHERAARFAKDIYGIEF